MNSAQPARALLVAAELGCGELSTNDCGAPLNDAALANSDDTRCQVGMNIAGAPLS